MLSSTTSNKGEKFTSFKLVFNYICIKVYQGYCLSKQFTEAFGTVLEWSSVHIEHSVRFETSPNGVPAVSVCQLQYQFRYSTLRKSRNDLNSGGRHFDNPAHPPNIPLETVDLPKYPHINNIQSTSRIYRVIYH